MREKDLSQFHYLVKEIQILQDQLEELKSRSLIKGKGMSGMPTGIHVSDPTGDLAAALREMEGLIESRLFKLYRVRSQIEQYIDMSDDTELRLILRLRCINHMSWEEIGEEIGMDRRTVSRKYYGQWRSAHNAQSESSILRVIEKHMAGCEADRKN